MKVLITTGNSNSKIAAFACVITEEGIKIPGFKIQEWESGQLMVFPPAALRKGAYTNVIHFSSREAQTMCFEAIIQAYEEYKLSNDEE